MRRAIQFLVLYFILPLSVFAQQIKLTGSVKDNKNTTVQGVSISLLNTSHSTLTNRQGQFVLENVFPGTYTLSVSAIGFATQSQQVTVNNSTGDLLITLQPVTTQLDEVVVTAQKREELLQQLPISVTAISSRQVQEYRLWNIRELSGIAPTLYAADPGDKRNVTSIRGITTTSYDPAVATYIDGVNQFNLDTYIPQLFDVERIEVLRGPQGTLYGRNAMGGVINIVTRQPSNATAAFAEVTVGNYNQQRYTTGIRTPLIKDKLFIGAAGMYDGFDGYYTNDFNTTKFDKQRSIAGNYYLKFLPTANWSIALNAKHVHNRNNGPFTLAYGDQAFQPAFHVNQNAVTKLIDNVWNSSLSINYTGRVLNFSSQTSYQSNHRFYNDPIDGDFSPLDAVTIINNYGKEWNNVKAVTQEFRFTSPTSSTSPLQWVAGSYLFLQDNPVKQTTRFGNDAQMIGSPDNNFSLINTTETKGKGIAVYGQASYRVNQKVDFIGGLRYDYEHKKQSVLGEYQKDPDPNPMFPYQPDTSASASFNAFSPKASIVFHASADNNLYATYSRGYRAGGLTPLSSDPSQPPLYAFEPENSNNYEIGSKNVFFNNRLQLNLTLFYTTINNAQVPTLVLPDAITITRNAGKLSSKGIEFEAAATPFKGFELNYAAGYTDAQYGTLKLAQEGSEADLKGKRQIFTPDVTSMLAAQYSYLLGGKQQLRLVVRGEWKYLGTQYFDLANSIKQSSYHLLHTRAGIASKNVSLMFWGRNLANKHYISYAYDFGAVHLGDPKTYGVTLAVQL